MRIVVRLKNIKEISVLCQLGVDVFCLDTAFSIKRIAHFGIPEIKKAKKEIALQDKKIYLFVNKMIHEEDLAPLTDFLKEVAKINIHGIIIRDLTVYVIAKQLGLEGLIIYQPGTMNTDSYSAHYLDQLHIKGMTISREITMDEIMNILSRDVSLEFSLVGHGYLDMFYSKRKLLTNYFKYKGITGKTIIDNHDFRLNEEIRHNDFYPIIEDAYGTMIFRSKKLMSYDKLKMMKNRLTDFYIERLFLSDKEYLDTIRLYNDLMTKEYFLSKYDGFDDGFYERPTELIKGDKDED